MQTLYYMNSAVLTGWNVTRLEWISWL